MGWWPFGRRRETSDRDVDVLRAEAAAATPSGPFRLTVEDVFSIAGRGTIVTGAVATGRLAVGQRVEVQRDGLGIASSAVTAIEQFRASLDVAEAGELVGLLLVELGQDQVQRGDVLVA